MSGEIENEELQEEVEAADVVTEEKVEEQPREDAQNEELQKALGRAEDFENKYLRAHVEMQSTQCRADEGRQQLRECRPQDLAKATLSSLDSLERTFVVEGLADNVRRGPEMTRDSLIRALDGEGVEEVVVESLDHNLHMAVQTLPADEEYPADSIAQVLQKGYRLHEHLLCLAMVVVYS